MDLIFMGTGDFAVPALRQLLDRGDAVRLLVTQPDRPQGRHRELIPATIKKLAIERGLPVFQPEDVNQPGPIEHLKALGADLLVVAAYGQILSKDLLGITRLGGVNLHASLLPKYRGAAPINWAIYHGDVVTGVTVIRMTPSLDAGGVLLQAETPIGSMETAGELEVRLADMGAPLVCRAIDGLAGGTLAPKKQDKSLATKAPKLTKEHGLIDWSRTSQGVCNQVRAMQPWPTAHSYLHRAGQAPERIIVERAVSAAAPERSPAVSPGGVLEASGDLLLVQTGDGAVRLSRLYPAGKRSMTAEELLRGRRLTPGDYFGSGQGDERSGSAERES
jgi:methionyl-tRNA formyltransferase